MSDSYLIIHPKDRFYWYSCYVQRVVDGDTVVLDFALGMSHIFMKQHVRLFGIDAPEMRGPSKKKGLEAKRHLQKLISNSIDLMCKTHKDKKGKYGRILVELFDNGRNLNQQMIKDGYALPLDEYGR